MTQPDKWDEIAAKYFYATRFMAWGPEDRNEFAQALRSAYDEGEKAGMERAAVICDENDYDWLNAAVEHQRGYGKEPMSLGDEIRRAAKETKE